MHNEVIKRLGIFYQQISDFTNNYQITRLSDFPGLERSKNEILSYINS